MLKKAFVLVLLLIIHLYSQQPTWKLLPNSPSSSSLDDISFINHLTGWTAGKYVYKTSDGGLNWTQLNSYIFYARSLLFIDSLNGFMGTLDSNNILFKTTNGGVNWVSVTNIPPPLPKGICGLSYAGNNVIYGCGTYRGPAAVIKSTDAGTTWQNINMNAYASTLIDCYFVSPDSGLIAGGLGPLFTNRKAIILFTSNGGASWVQRMIASTDSNWCWKISFPNRNTGYASVQKTTNTSQYVFKTTNGGINWSELPAAGIQQGIGFVNDTLGWAGFNEIRETTNGGNSWNLINMGDPNPFINRFRFYGDTLGYASGGRVFKYTADKSIGILNNQTGLPADFSLSQNYPNPFNPATTFKYEIFDHTMTVISIFNVLGQEIYKFVNSYRAPGMYEFHWDGMDMNNMLQPSGVYFYRIENGKNAETKKMILAR